MFLGCPLAAGCVAQLPIGATTRHSKPLLAARTQKPEPQKMQQSYTIKLYNELKPHKTILSLPVPSVDPIWCPHQTDQTHSTFSIATVVLCFAAGCEETAERLMFAGRNARITRELAMLGPAVVQMLCELLKKLQSQKEVGLEAITSMTRLCLVLSFSIIAFCYFLSLFVFNVPSIDRHNVTVVARIPKALGVGTLCFPECPW